MRITRSQLDALKAQLNKSYPGSWTDYFFTLPIQYYQKNQFGEKEIRVTKAQFLFFDIDHGKVFAIRGEYGFLGTWTHHPRLPWKKGFLKSGKVFKLPDIISGPVNGELFKYLDEKTAMKKIFELMEECDIEMRLHSKK